MTIDRRVVVLEEVLTKDRSSGRVHARYLTPMGKYATLEGCNLDQSGEWDEISPPELAGADLCENEWPLVPADPA